MAISFLPCCTQCSAVTESDGWLKMDGQALITAQKLSACARCHLARYCGLECQKEHWTVHKSRCLLSKRSIGSREADQIVRGVRLSKPGKAIFYLDSRGKFLKAIEDPSEDERLSVIFEIKNVNAARYDYLACKRDPSHWKSRLDAIIHPRNGIHNPGSLVTLGHEMIKMGLYREAFRMIAHDKPAGYPELTELFFVHAVWLMSSKNVDLEVIVSCAALLNKNRVEVEVAIFPPKEIDLPEGLQKRIDEAKEMSYGKRDVAMVDLANEVMNLSLYDQAFKLVFDWVALDPAKAIFFRSAAKKLIHDRVPYEKLVQLARTIGITDHQILNAAVEIYARNGQISFACQLAKQSNKPDYYLEIAFSALLLNNKRDSATEILKLVSERKRRELEYHLTRPNL